MSLIEKIKSQKNLVLIFHFLNPRKIFDISFKSKYLYNILNLKKMYQRYFQIINEMKNLRIINNNCFIDYYTNDNISKRYFFDITELLIEQIKINKSIIYQIPFQHILLDKIIKLNDSKITNYIIIMNYENLNTIIKSKNYKEIYKIQNKILFEFSDIINYHSFNEIVNFELSLLKELNLENIPISIDLSSLNCLEILIINNGDNIIIPYQNFNKLKTFWCNEIKITIKDIPQKYNYKLFNNIKSLKLENINLYFNKCSLNIKVLISDEWDSLWDFVFQLNKFIFPFITKEFPNFNIEIYDGKILYEIYDIKLYFYFDMLYFNFENIIKLEIQILKKNNHHQKLNLSNFINLKKIIIGTEYISNPYNFSFDISYKISNQLKKLICDCDTLINIFDIPNNEEIELFKNLVTLRITDCNLKIKCFSLKNINYSRNIISFIFKIIKTNEKIQNIKSYTQTKELIFKTNEGYKLNIKNIFKLLTANQKLKNSDNKIKNRNFIYPQTYEHSRYITHWKTFMNYIAYVNYN